MLSSVRTWAPRLLLLTVLATSLGGCSEKEDDPAAVATTGIVEGTISPSGSIINVTATNAGGLTFLAAPNATTGAFSLPNLAPGTYTLSFTPANGYVTPTSRTITVVAGQTASAGTVVVASNGLVKGGTMSWNTDGVTYSSTQLVGEVNAAQGLLYITSETLTGDVRDLLNLSLAQSFAGTGTYTLGSTYQNASLQRINKGLITAQYRTTDPAAGTITISSYNAVAGTMSGTFGFSGTDFTGSSPRTATVTNGTFTLRF
ncbi:carboxypeptidase-like regulatory domain-containing protein [Hymenobacter cellulosilyticus]|uniref:Carboxypeptidase-like regulatory domain-containing protein n=1 Tax=Hymenobacter cellulosilyticus TaxID=2932248 RepID=A0A8T9Q028_9BACT|nr:carboxypeptidase-like regulatory domain-containing protein [Hymenobacter cellulosilyticus]UOQ71116.1 carboxypeptidase-like regulatory domain-containing protein [Hymenobacter cellulosilyticus]